MSAEAAAILSGAITESVSIFSGTILLVAIIWAIMSLINILSDS